VGWRGWGGGCEGCEGVVVVERVGERVGRWKGVERVERV